MELDAQLALLENALARYQIDVKLPGPIGSRHPSITPFGVFKAQDGHLVLAAGNDRIFPMLCEAIGLPEAIAGARFKTNHNRCENHLELKALIEQALAARTVRE